MFLFGFPLTGELGGDGEDSAMIKLRHGAQEFNGIYPRVNIQKAIENGHF